MFSVQQKRDISNAVQTILRDTAHPELPTTGEVSFLLHVDGAEPWSFADIKNNGSVLNPSVNPHNEHMAEVQTEAREKVADDTGRPLHKGVCAVPRCEVYLFDDAKYCDMHEANHRMGVE